MSPRRTETTHGLSAINPMLILAMALAAIGWVGVVYLLLFVRPTSLTLAVFFAAWAIALSGTAWPILLALHRRFLGEPSAWTVWRQSAWFGIFGALAAWLQLNHILNVATAVIFAGVFLVIEVILSLRARQEVQDD